jgi:hypothetical protein
MPPTTAQYAPSQLSFDVAAAYDRKRVPIDSTGQYCIWSVEGKPYEIRLALDVVDRLNPEVMRGFGAVRRRGTEVGGILLGSIEPTGDHHILITVQDFELVSCEYAFGPSYQLSPDDLQRFRTSLAKFDPSSGKPVYTVGFFRSHTRDGLQPDEGDIRFFREYFTDPYHVAMLVKPYATRASQAGFFFQEKGVLPLNASYLEFPFRKRELMGESGEVPEPVRPVRLKAVPAAPALIQEEPLEKPEPVVPLSRPESVPSTTGWGRPPAAVEEVPQAAPIAAAPEPVQEPFRLSGYSLDEPAPRPWKARLGWLSLGVMLVLLGIVLGMQYAGLVFPTGVVSSAADPYSLNLSAERKDSSVLVRWDRQSPAVQQATRGILTVTEGNTSTTVSMEAPQLQNGTVLYRHLAPEIRFRLELFLKEGRSIVETTTWRSAPSESALRQLP